MGVMDFRTEAIVLAHQVHLIVLRVGKRRFTIDKTTFSYITKFAGNFPYQKGS